MTQRKQYNKILLLGSGTSRIGEAGEFDYSGSQALKAVKAEGTKTVLINPNIATVQTSEGVADAIYFLPVTPYFVERVIEHKRPDDIMLAFGGQTAFNCGAQLFQPGVLECYGIGALGTPVEAIMATEDRELFVEKLDEIEVRTIQSHAVTTMEDVLVAASQLDYPVTARTAYALGGSGSGFCDNDEELRVLAEKAFASSPQLLIEKSLHGRKEIEHEVVRDAYDNCITTCSMESFDPPDIHTGENIVIVPSQTLSNDEYHKLHTVTTKIICHFGVVGECNVQYAPSLYSEDYRAIEVNTRLSRPSAPTSRATGYPLVHVAAKFGLSYGFLEMQNAATGPTPVSPELALDCCVCKILRRDLGKSHGVFRQLGSSMKSVGEVMAIGYTSEEAIQKGLHMIEQGMYGFCENKKLVIPNIDTALREPADTRIFVISKAFHQGYGVEQIHESMKTDRWFLYRLQGILETAETPGTCESIKSLPAKLLRQTKEQGFTDFQITRAVIKEYEKPPHKEADQVRQYRKSPNILPYVKQIDTLTIEVSAESNYLYLTYHDEEHDIATEQDGKSAIVLGSGAYRTGSSVELDWCDVNALRTIRKAGLRFIMINYNPETVSTDSDMSDRLYFDELTFEHVMDIIDLEAPKGVTLATGGQIPDNLALRLAANGVIILGTQAEDIDYAEDRHKFFAMLDELGIGQSEWSEFTTIENIDHFVDRVGYPILVRSSYVLLGAVMNVCSNQGELLRLLQLAASMSQNHPVVVPQFVEHAKEIEMGVVAGHGEIIAYVISEHIEFVGVHSGDATVQLLAQKPYVETIRRIKRTSRQIVEALHILGPLDIQFLTRGNETKVIGYNLRAPRSFPFVSKALRLNFIDLTTKITLGLPYEHPTKDAFLLDYAGVKASQFSSSCLQKADSVSGVDIVSTGKVGCIGEDIEEAILKAMFSMGYHILERGILLSTGGAKQKVDLLEASQLLHKKGYKLYATAGTQYFLEENGVPAALVRWPDNTEQPQALDLLHQHEIDFVVSIDKNLSTGELTNGYKLCRAAIDLNIPPITNIRLAATYIKVLCMLSLKELEIESWQKH